MPRCLPALLLALAVLAAAPLRAQEPGAALAAAPTAPAVQAPAATPAADGLTLKEAAPAPVEVLTLDAAFRLALKTDEQVRISEKELQKARLQPLRAWTYITPRANIQGTYTRYANAVSFSSSAAGGTPELFPLDLYQANFRVVQPLFEPTFLTRRSAAGNFIAQGCYGLQQTAKSRLFDTASAYYNVLKAQSLVDVARQTLDLANQELRVANARFQVGEETKTAVLRAEVDVTRGERDLVQSRNGLKLAQATLANIIHQPATFEVAAPAAQEPATEALHTYQEQAVKYRDDLKVEQENLCISKYNRDLVQEELYPNANATFTYTRVTPQTLIQPDDFWSLVVGLNIPIFEGGLTYVNLDEARKTIRQAELRVENLRREISIQVENAYLQVQTLASTLSTLEKQVQYAAENYDIIFKQFQVGVATSLDVTNALTSLTSARTDLANERYNYQVALLNLQQTTGIFARDYTAQLCAGPGGPCLEPF